MKSSTMLICRVKSISDAGPFQRISTPNSRPAAIAPACTVCQKMCACALGTTAMTGLLFFLQVTPGSRQTKSAMLSIFFIRIPG